jgi:hypothetical protein
VDIKPGRNVRKAPHHQRRQHLALAYGGDVPRRVHRASASASSLGCRSSSPSHSVRGLRRFAGKRARQRAGAGQSRVRGGRCSSRACGPNFCATRGASPARAGSCAPACVRGCGTASVAAPLGLGLEGGSPTTEVFFSSSLTSPLTAPVGVACRGRRGGAGSLADAWRRSRRARRRDGLRRAACASCLRCGSGESCLRKWACAPRQNPT